MLQELQKRLRQSEQKVLELEKTNRQLALTASEAEESSLSQIRWVLVAMVRVAITATHSPHQGSAGEAVSSSSPPSLSPHPSPTKPHPLLTDEGKSILVPTAPPTTLLTPHHPHTLITH